MKKDTKIMIGLGLISTLISLGIGIPLVYYGNLEKNKQEPQLNGEVMIGFGWFFIAGAIVLSIFSVDQVRKMIKEASDD